MARTNPVTRGRISPGQGTTFHKRHVKSLKNKTKLEGEWENGKLVYCTKCGTSNEDKAEFCMKCGASLQTGTVESRRYEKRRAEEECFGLPHGGAIVGLIIGGLILLGGFFALAQQQGWITRSPDLGWLVIIIIGILLIAGAIYRMRSRP